MPHNDLLPSSIHDRGDIARLRRELQLFAEHVQQAKLTKRSAPRTEHLSPSLHELAELYKVSLTTVGDRDFLVKQLTTLHKNAPVVHVTFPLQPTTRTIEAVLEWFRGNTEGNVLMQTGVDPSLLVGCQVRTTNKVFSLQPTAAFEATNLSLSKELAAL